ncbi:Asp hemolysin [Coniochaeta sp. PMI_546]|nr:Asp hemolysin [Coniochaeta sp. PMI_546]
MAYAQWIYMIVQNMMRSGNLTIQGAGTSWGKFYQWDNKDKEISSGDVDNLSAQPSGNLGIASCGREDASSGTEGGYDIYDGTTKVCHISWDCPWGSKTNTFDVSDINDNYIVQATGANLYGGAIGTVTTKVVKVAA